MKIGNKEGCNIDEVEIIEIKFDGNLHGKAAYKYSALDLTIGELDANSFPWEKDTQEALITLKSCMEKDIANLVFNKIELVEESEDDSEDEDLNNLLTI